MRDSYRAYYKPTNEELSEIWNDGIIVLDTNTLLNFFRYTPSTRDEFLKVLEKLCGSLWIPYHVGLEFQRQRLEVISTTNQAFSKITSSLDKAEKEIVTTLNGFKHHPSINRSELEGKVKNFFKELTENLDSLQEEHGEQVVGNGGAEQTFHRITSLFTGKVGASFSETELNEIYAEGTERYKQEIPPGYKDRGKTSNQYGDLVIWKEILKLGKDKKLPVIFVTDDTKDDWWWRQGGQTQGPRVELVDEYWSHAEQRIHFYEPLRFLEYALDRTNTQISPRSLEEVEEVSNSKIRVLRLLRERHSNLEEQRLRLLQQQEHMQIEPLNSTEIQVLRDEIESVVFNKRSLERRVHESTQQVDELLIGLDATDDSIDIQAFRSHISERRDEIQSFEKHIEALSVQARKLERQIRRGKSPDNAIRKTVEKQLVAVQDELNEVALALEELND